MKKWFSVLLATMLICMAVGVWAEVEPVHLKQRGESEENPIELQEGTLYYVEPMRGQYRWYSFIAHESGMYTFFSEPIKGSAITKVYNKYGEKMFNQNLVIGLRTMDAKKGEKYTIFMDVYPSDRSFWFAFCSPTQHVSLGSAEIRQAATCETDGYMAQICEYCGGEGARVAIPATGHKTSMVTVQKATCTDNGLDSEICQTCGAVLSNVATPATGHQASDWKRKASATCTEDGVEYTACTVCGVELESRAIPAVGHKSGGMTTVQAATCIQSGLDQDICVYCGEVLASVAIPMADHIADVWQTGRETTCVNDGYRYQLCIVCGKTLNSETIPAYGHSESDWKTIDASCTENGKRYKACTVCGHELEQEAIPATGHQYGEWIETLAPTTKADGTETRTCLFCGAQEKRAVAKLTLIEGILGRKK